LIVPIYKALSANNKAVISLDGKPLLVVKFSKVLPLNLDRPLLVPNHKPPAPVSVEEKPEVKEEVKEAVVESVVEPVKEKVKEKTEAEKAIERLSGGKKGSK